MRLLFAALALVSPLALVQAAVPPSAIVADPDAPKGRLPDTARPLAYRIDMTIVPDRPTFTGHVEIDTMVRTDTSRLYLHGHDLTIAKAVAIVAGQVIPGKWAQVDKSGTARLDFKTPLPAGKLTLAFDYGGAFGSDPTGLYHVKVGPDWYAWSQFESIDARSAFPSFDEPGFKTPFTISITTKPGYRAVSNAPEATVIKAGTLEKHQFQPTLPLPTYLVAMMAGPFITAEGAAPAGPDRPAPLPLRIVATKAQAGKLDYALAETPRILTLLEHYFGQTFPFPKLDQIASPIMPGAMENAGADTYGDEYLLLAPDAPTRAKQEFGSIVAHELSHQWFGDLVTPAWWDDIWLNESFANWMGYRIGNAWRPELKIGVGAIGEALQAMDTDALEVGRPIHQPIADNADIDSTFDAVTYGKGGQVVAMIAAYLGDEEFQAGVRLHLSRHRYGNATSDDFFQALADAAHDRRVLAALKSFVDQPGVPVVSLHRDGDGSYVATQHRYAFLGSTPAPLRWTIPFCYKYGDTQDCRLLDQASTPIRAIGSGPLLPNAGGKGYYRFELDAQDWAALIADGARLGGGEALATTDSLWAAFAAGKVDAGQLIAAMRAMAGNPNSDAAVDGGQRLARFRSRGLIGEASLADYRAVLTNIYGPKLAAIGFDPAAGAQAGDDPDRQKLRQDLVDLVAINGHEPATRAKLLAAGNAYLAGNAKALDPAFLAAALSVVLDEGGLATARTLMEKALASEDPVLRPAAIGAIGSTGKPDVARWLFAFEDKRLRPPEQRGLFFALAANPETRDMATDWLKDHFDALAKAQGITVASLPTALIRHCSVERAANLDATYREKVKALGAGELTFARTIERIRHCGDLKAAKADEIAAALKAAAS